MLSVRAEGGGTSAPQCATLSDAIIGLNTNSPVPFQDANT
jgi:hypothetical protein